MADLIDDLFFKLVDVESSGAMYYRLLVDLQRRLKRRPLGPDFRYLPPDRRGLEPGHWHCPPGDEIVFKWYDEYFRMLDRLRAAIEIAKDAAVQAASALDSRTAGPALMRSTELMFELQGLGGACPYPMSRGYVIPEDVEEPEIFKTQLVQVSRCIAATRVVWDFEQRLDRLAKHRPSPTVIQGHEHSPPHSESAPPEESEVPPPRNSVFFEGRQARVTFAGECVVLRCVRGLVILTRLFENQGAGVPVEILDGAPKKGDAAPLVDQEARSEYQKRLEELMDARAEALETEDEDALLRIDAETDALQDELKAAGPQARPRLLDSAREDARNRVKDALGRAFARLREAHPRLHAHLEKSVVRWQGNKPCYAPADRVTWVVEGRPEDGPDRAQ